MKITLSIIGLCLCITLSHAQGEFNLNENYNISEEGTLHLDTEDADVTIKGAHRNDVGVSIYRKVKGKQYGNKKFDIEVVEKNGDLYIKELDGNERVKFSMTVNSSTIYTIDIEVPHSIDLDIKGEDDNYALEYIDGSVFLKSEDGDIVMQKMGSEVIDINLEDGNIQLSEVSPKLKLKLEDGNFMSQKSEYYQIDIEVEDGNIRFDDGKIGDCKIKTEDGDIAISSAFKTNAKVDLSTEDGDVDINSNGAGGSFIVTMEDGDVSFSQRSLQLESKSKHKHVYNTIKKGNVEVNISVEDGDVDIAYEGS